MARCYEFAQLKRKYYGHGNNGGGQKKEVSFYEECLKKSDYSQTLKDFYFKNKYKYVCIPERFYNSPAFLEKIKHNYQQYLSE